MLRNRFTLRRAAVFSLDAACALLCAVVLVFGFAAPAYAYVDPSVMTYTIQALAGVAVALSAVIGVVWRRVRRVLMRVLRIDESAGKEADPSVSMLDPADADYEQKCQAANERAVAMKTSLGTVKSERLCWGTRFFFALAASLMLFFTIVFVGPMELVASNRDSLFFMVNDVWVPLAVTAAVGTLVLAVALSALNGRAYGVCLAVVAVIGVASYVQAMFLNASLPPADGSDVAWGDYTIVTVISALVWLVMLVGGVFLSLRKSLVFKGVTTAVCLTCVLAQAIGLGVLLATPDDKGYLPIEAKPAVTMDGVMDVSSKENVIVFVLDTFDVNYLNQCIERDPSALDGFTGFTCFTNSVGSMIPTRYALSTLLTGRGLTEQDEYYSTEKIIDWYTERNLLDDIKDRGYSVDLYCADLHDAIEQIGWRADNIRPLDLKVDPVAAVTTLVKCSLYRDMPWAVKPLCWYYTDEVNNRIIVNDEADLAASTWTIDDAKYHELLKNQDLQVVDRGERGSFRVIHMAGSHYPIILDRNGEVASGETDTIEQSLGALHIVDVYLEELKQLGLYDGATIVITADHGEWYLADEITCPTSPMLMVKPATEEGGSAAQCAFSDVPTGHADIAPTLLDAVGADSSLYGGMNVFDVPDAPRTRYYNATSVVGPDHVYAAIKQWKIEGDALVWENWSETGVEWPIE